MPFPPARDIVVVHSSDLHVDHDYTARLHGGDGTAGLGCVLAAARDLSADVVLLAGDTFDSHRVPQDLIEQAAAVIGASALPVVILPGNHDPAIATAIYRDSPLKAVKNLHVIGVTHDNAIAFPNLALEVWGRPHRDYDDMIPFETVRARRSPDHRRRSFDQVLRHAMAVEGIAGEQHHVGCKIARRCEHAA